MHPILFTCDRNVITADAGQTGHDGIWCKQRPVQHIEDSAIIKALHRLVNTWDVVQTPVELPPNSLSGSRWVNDARVRSAGDCGAVPDASWQGLMRLEEEMET